MEHYTSEGNCTPLTLSALRLLVPPVQLVSAVIWQTVQQKVVSDYGMLEEFVSTVTDIVPELLTTQQRAQLLLGLRARLILDLCRFEATADFELVQPHLDRVQTLIKVWVMEAGATNMEMPASEFVDLVKNLLESPAEREHFFQNVFPEEFGPTYDEALCTLMWIFLSRLEKLFPPQTFQQVASMFGEVSSALEECMDSVSRREEFKHLLQYQKHLCQLNHNDGSLDGACIISALKLSSVERTETDKPQAIIVNNVLSSTSDLDNESLTLPIPIVSEDQTDEIHEENGTAKLLGDITKPNKNMGLLESQAQDVSYCLKQCHVLLKRLDMPLSFQHRPVRPNRGLKMKKILLEEKRQLHLEALPAFRSASMQTKPSSRAESSDNEDSSSFFKDSYMAPITECSDDDSWSYYSDVDSCHKTHTSSPSMAGSWSNYSDDECASATRARSCTEDDSWSSCSNEDPSVIIPKSVSAPSKKPRMSKVKASSPKKTRTFLCFICKEQVNSLRAHTKTHFPTGDYACPRCDSRFKLYSSLKQHMTRTCFEFIQQQVDPEKPDETKDLYKCDKCEEAFRSKVALGRHKLTHNELYCHVCRKVLKDAATLARHKSSHTPFQCNRCEESFTLFKPLLRHYQNIHKISRPFRCNRCTKVFTKVRGLIAHEWRHTGHLPFQCTQCGLRCRCDADLISHERVHTREKPYLCTECGKTFSHRSNLLRHLNFIHSESRNEKKHPCSQCEKSFKEKTALQKHQRRKHLNELFRHPCPYCGKMVSDSSIARHKLIHTGERPFKCTVPECDKYFRSTSEVKRHVLIHHTTERPYKCDICGKGFIKMGYLNVHAKVHSGEKPFVCHVCGKAFPKMYSMQRHKRLVHTSVTQ